MLRRQEGGQEWSPLALCLSYTPTCTHMHAYAGDGAGRLPCPVPRRPPEAFRADSSKLCLHQGAADRGVHTSGGSWHRSENPTGRRAGVCENGECGRSGGFTHVGAHGTGARIPPVDEQVCVRTEEEGEGFTQVGAHGRGGRGGKGGKGLWVRLYALSSLSPHTHTHTYTHTLSLSRARAHLHARLSHSYTHMHVRRSSPCAWLLPPWALSTSQGAMSRSCSAWPRLGWAAWVW